MKRMITRAAAAAGSLALVGGAVVAGAAPAGADPFGNGAYGAATGGTVFTPPVANATPEDSPLVASNANVAGILTTGVILDRSDPGGSSSHVTQGIVVNVPGLRVDQGQRGGLLVPDHQRRQQRDRRDHDHRRMRSRSSTGPPTPTSA